MDRPQSKRRLAPLAFALILVVLPTAGLADEGAPAAPQYSWKSCSGDSARFVVPAGWRLSEKEVSDGVTACTLRPGPAADDDLGQGSITFKHWSKWPVSVGVEPFEYAASSVQRLSRTGRVIERHSGTAGASLVQRIELVTTSGDQQTHQWVLFVSHPRHRTLDLVIAAWPEGSWDEALQVIQPTLKSLRFADREE